MQPASSFAGLVDLASERIGGKTLLANDAFFASETNLIKPGRGIFIPDKYTDEGKWMDGWETRRRRDPGYDWCILKLGVPGTIGGLDIDTNHFLGNHAPYASVEACCADEETSVEALQGWQEILPRSPLNPGSQNLFPVFSQGTWTHVRLNIFPDGGVARFRVYGSVSPPTTDSTEDVDLAALVNGARVLHCNDMFFGDMNNLIMPNRGINMGDGWETRRKRIPGHDWCIIKLARVGKIRKAVVDTHHFKGNFPESCSLEGCNAPDRSDHSMTDADCQWESILPRQKLGPHAEHAFSREIIAHEPLSHVRFNIFPDGGVSRLRLFGTL